MSTLSNKAMCKKCLGKEWYVVEVGAYGRTVYVCECHTVREQPDTVEVIADLLECNGYGSAAAYLRSVVRPIMSGRETPGSSRSVAREDGSETP